MRRLHESNGDPSGGSSHPNAISPACTWEESLAMGLHDLGSALSVVCGTVQLWRLGSRLNTSPAEDWACIYAASDRAMRLSRELLAICQARHFKFQPDRRPMDLVGLVDAVVDRRRPAFESAGQWLWVEKPDCPIWISADRDLLERVLDNLLDNATKYTPPGGRVTIDVDRQENEAIIRVCDSGFGISSEFLPHVFEPFRREERRSVRTRPGSGVGLLTVRRIVEMHDGRVEAASPGPGLGSEFTIRLPGAECH